MLAIYGHEDHGIRRFSKLRRRNPAMRSLSAARAGKTRNSTSKIGFGADSARRGSTSRSAAVTVIRIFAWCSSPRATRSRDWPIPAARPTTTATARCPRATTTAARSSTCSADILQNPTAAQYPVLDLVMCHGELPERRSQVRSQEQKREGLRELRRHHDPRPQDVRRADSFWAGTGVAHAHDPSASCADLRRTSPGISGSWPPCTEGGGEVDRRLHLRSAKQYDCAGDGPESRCRQEHQFVAYRLTGGSREPVHSAVRAVPS